MRHVILGLGASIFVVHASIGRAQDFEAQRLDYATKCQETWCTRGVGGFVAGTGTFQDASGKTTQPALRFDATGPHLLPFIGSDTVADAYAIDADGVLVGDSYSPGKLGEAVLWSGGSVTDLQSLVVSGATIDLETAYDIDSSGRIIGVGFDASKEIRGFLLDQGVLTDLGSLFPSPQYTAARAMNDQGQIVGFSSDSSASQLGTHAFLWDQGVLQDLHDPTILLGRISTARDVDSSGRVCGAAEFASGLMQATLWDHGTITPLGYLKATYPFSMAKAMNDAGDIVGTSVDSHNNSRAVLWRGGGTIVDLNTLIDPALGITLEAAEGIDEEGRITANGHFGSLREGFLLLPACDGSFELYGSGYRGSGPFDPMLAGWGCPSPDRDFAVAAVRCLENTVGVLFFGTGRNRISTGRGPELQIDPLLPIYLFVTTSSEGDWAAYANLPTGTPSFDVNLQLLLVDPGAAHGISSTNPLALHFE